MTEDLTHDVDGVLLVVDEDTLLMQKIEDDFKTVISSANELEDSSEFVKTYGDLMNSVKVSRNNELRLAERLHELAEEMGDNTTKMQAAIKLSHDDTQAIESLTQDAAKLIKLIDSLKEQESTVTKQIDELKQQIIETSELIQSGTAVHINEEETVNEFMQLKEKLLSERNRNTQLLSDMRNKQAEAMEKLRLTEREKTELETQYRSIVDAISQCKSNAAKERKKRDMIESELDTIRNQIKNAENEQKEVLDTVKSLSDKKRDKEKELKEQLNLQQAAERILKRELERQNRAESELNDAKTQLTSLQHELETRKTDLRENEKRVKELQSQTDSIRKQVAVVRKSLIQTASEKAKLEKKKADMVAYIGNLELEYENTVQEHQAQLKGIVAARRDQSLIKRSIGIHTSQIAELKAKENMEKEKVRIAEQEHYLFKIDNQQLRKRIAALELERKSYATKTATTHQRILQVIQELSMRDMAIHDLQQRITEAEGRLRQQQQAYDAVCADRNLFSKNLVETQTELNELNTRFKVMTSAIEQQRNGIRAVDNEISKTILTRKTLEKRNAEIIEAIEQLQLERKEGEKVITDQLAEIAKFNDLISASESESKRQSCKTQDVITEKDKILTTYNEKTKEAAKLTEELDILERISLMSEQGFSKDVLKLRELRAEAALLTSKLAELKRKSLGYGTSDKQRLVALDKLIGAERNREAILRAEMERPLNIHKWRQLEGFDHSTYELLKKVQATQKGLIRKNGEIEAKDKLIEEKESEYRALKNLLAHQPGMEVTDQVQGYKETLDEKKRQLTALANELVSYKSQVDSLKQKIEEKKEIIQSAKDRYFKRRRSEYSYIHEKHEERIGKIPAMEYDELLE